MHNPSWHSYSEGWTWLESLDSDTLIDNRDGSIWRIDRSKWLKSVEEVEVYLNTLNTGTYNDWRLSTKSELYKFIEIFDWEKNGQVNIRIEGNHWVIDDNNRIIDKVQRHPFVHDSDIDSGVLFKPLLFSRGQTGAFL